MANDRDSRDATEGQIFIDGLTSLSLKPLTSGPVPGRKLRLSFWWGVTTILGGLIASIVFGLLPVSWGGLNLYWIHDNIYLPIKGHTYILYYPKSLIWASGAFILVVLCLGFWLTDHSVIRFGHILLLRGATRVTAFHPYLIDLAHRFSDYNVEPQMMRAVAEQRWTQLAHRVATKPPGEASTSDLSALRRMTTLRLELEFLPPLRPVTVEHLRAALLLHDFAVLLRYHGQYSQEDGDSVIRLARPNPSWWREAAAEEDPFQADSLLANVFLLALIPGKSLDSAQDTIPEYFKSIGLQTPTALTDPQSFLLSSVALRVSQFKQWQRSLEQPRWDNYRGPQTPSHILEEDAATYWNVIGQLATGIALHLALLTDSQTEGSRFLDAVEALKLTSALVPPNSPPSVIELAGQIKPLLSGVPRPFDYAIWARLLGEASPQQAEWDQELLSWGGDGIIRSTDFDMAFAHQRSVHLASGPDYPSIPQKK